MRISRKSEAKMPEPAVVFPLRKLRLPPVSSNANTPKRFTATAKSARKPVGNVSLPAEPSSVIARRESSAVSLMVASVNPPERVSR